MSRLRDAFSFEPLDMFLYVCVLALAVPCAAVLLRRRRNRFDPEPPRGARRPAVKPPD